MKVAIITRSTLLKAPGGDTTQIIQTARKLLELGVQAEVRLTNELIDYNSYDLFHLFNLTRPADILKHAQKIQRPIVLSPILVSYQEFDKYHRTGLPGAILRLFSADLIEYVKTVSRWLIGSDTLVTKSYLWKGQHTSVINILDKTSILVAGSGLELQELFRKYGNRTNSRIVPNGIDTDRFTAISTARKNRNTVLCVARIEGLKNQANLIRALNNTHYQLLIIGDPSLNQHHYYKRCIELASNNITFIPYLPQDQLLSYYANAQVHVLPSWFETCGLSSLEAAALGCNIVITDKGFTREYFEDYAFYCDPASPDSIREAVDKAANSPFPDDLRKKILAQYTWQQAAELTLSAYKQVLKAV